MTEETERPVNGRASSPRPGSPGGDGAGQSVYYNAARHGQHVEESPELLRWRADLLMDEMMMGGVDVSAADSGTRTFSGVESPTSSPNGRNGVDANGGYAPYPTDRGPNSAGNTPDGYGGRRSPDRSEREPNGRAPTDLAHEPNGARFRDQNDRYAPPVNGDRYANGGTLPTRDPLDSPRDDRPGANGGYPTDTPNSPPTRRTPPLYPAGSGDANAGSARPRADEPPSDRFDRYAQPYDGDRTGVDFGFDDEPQPPRARPESPARDRRLDLPSTPPRTQPDAAPTSPNVDTAPRSDRLYSLEQRYAQLRREQADKIEPVPVTPPPPPAPPVNPRPPRPAAADPHDPTQWAVGPEKWNWQDFSAQPGEEPEPEPELPPMTGRYTALDRAPQADSAAVRQDPAQFVNSMSVFDNKKKRSTLLPRMSELDMDTLQREISALHGELSQLLPVGNETGERARHLLDKAYTILQSDPMRSAEVEYYMQQVRTIVSRLHQARQWSDLYRSRLNVYLWAWFGLSLVLLLARFLLQENFDSFLTLGFGLAPDNFLVQHWSSFVGTAFAGALGGAAGALYTMRVHARAEHGFFDRKYGLRGLILPLIGLLIGAVGYWVFGLVYAVTGINPAESLVAGLIPALAALGFGLSQETIYGTRG